jgi:hypothetical protein
MKFKRAFVLLSACLTVLGALTFWKHATTYTLQGKLLYVVPFALGCLFVSVWAIFVHTDNAAKIAWVTNIIGMILYVIPRL